MPCPSGRICAFTGHRPNKYPYLSDETSPEYGALKLRLSEQTDALIAEGYTHFVCGGALGVDTLAARLVLEKRAKNPLITLEIVVPCPEQHKFWTEKDKRIYEDILESADVVTTVSEVYTPDCMFRRNRCMVDMCSSLVAVYDGTPGGTYMTLKYALDTGKRALVLRP